MIIMGIDPGTARVGWAIVKTEKNTASALAYGCIETEASGSVEKRLLFIHDELNNLILKYHPDNMSLEELFFSKNVKTALNVSEARGVILYTAAQNNIEVVSYSPRTIKLAIAGTGSADKKQMQRMVTQLLHLPTIPTPDDVADAIAVALTHVYSYKIQSLTV